MKNRNYNDMTQTTYQKRVESMGSINRKSDRLFEIVEETPINRLRLAKELSYLRSELETLTKLIETVEEFVEMTNQETNYEIIK